MGMSFHSLDIDKANKQILQTIGIVTSLKEKSPKVQTTNNKQHEYALTVFPLSLLCSSCIPSVTEKQDVADSVAAV